MSDAPARYGHVGRAPGRDTRAILAEAGYDEAEIAALLATGAAVEAR